MFALCFSTAFLAIGALSQQLGGPIIDTPLGRVVGWERLSRDGRLYQAWTALPYAQPPVGKLRFKAPQPVQKWTGVLNATVDPPLCLQSIDIEFTNPFTRGSEDCLYLNVYRPKNGLLKMPVLFRVHGGAFQVGDLGPRENADYLMDEDVVLVQIHYRLNGIGFMGLNDKLMPGNFGMRDQIMALKWVKQNIEYFGGDPESVTVLGESAGGASTHILLKSPAAEGLVHRALSDSGTANNIWSEVKPEKVRNGTLAVAEKVGCQITGTNQEIFDCLQNATSEQLIKAMLTGSAAVNAIHCPQLASFAPSYDPEGTEDPVIPEDLSLTPSKKPWITGNCNGEFLLTLRSITPQMVALAQKDIDAYLEMFITKYSPAMDPARVREGVEILKSAYFTVEKPVNELTVDLAKLEANTLFFFPALYDLKNHDGPKWYYILEYVGEIGRLELEMYAPGMHLNVVGHAQQQLFYFNRRSLYKGLSPTETPDDYKVSKRMIKYLVNFAYYDDPTPAGASSKWDQFTENQILKVATSDGDSIGGQSFYQPLLNVLNTWSYLFGWNSHQ